MNQEIKVVFKIYVQYKKFYGSLLYGKINLNE